MAVPRAVRRPRRIIVGLHDVAPPFADEIRRQLDALAAAGVRRCVLKVVPNWHGCHPLSEAPAFAALLREQAAAGSQLVLHGLEHRPRGPWRGPAWTRLHAAVFAPGAAEFATLPRAAAARSVREGLAAFARASLPRPSAFCAPGWVLTPAAAAGVADAGMRYIVNMVSLRDLATGRRHWLPAIGQMGAPAAHEAGVQILNGMMRAVALPMARTVKVYLHPRRDPRSPVQTRLLAWVVRMVAEGGWRPATYDEVYGDD
jgi:predicted deacetylase